MPYTQVSEYATLLGVARNVDLNSGNTDNQIDVPLGKYIVDAVIVTDPSTSLGSSAATLGVFTSTGGGGTTVVTSATLTELTAASKYKSMTIAENDDSLTSASLYARVGTAHGSAATVDVYIYGRPLPT